MQQTFLARGTLSVCFALTMVACVATPDPAWSGAIPSTQKPVRTHPSLADPPLCYMQTVRGKLLDLTPMCGYISPVVCSQVASDPAKWALLANFCNQRQKCLLTGTCNDTPPIRQPNRDNRWGK
jgi:hypothetical protein